MPEHFNLPWCNALADGAFDDLPIQVQFDEYPGGTGEMTSAMKEGSLDVALLLFEGAVTNILREHAHRIVKVYVRSPLIWGIHVAADSSIQSIDEISDKVYAISRAGSGSHLIAIVDAAERGWPTENMKFSKVGNLTGAREKLANGKVDIFLWEKFTTQPLVDSGEFRRVGEREVPWPAFVVSVRSELLESHGQPIRSMLEIVDKYCRDFKQDANSVEEVTARFQIQPDDARAWFDHVCWESGFDRPDETIVNLINYLEQVNLIEPANSGPDDVWYELPAG